MMRNASRSVLRRFWPVALLGLGACQGGAPPLPCEAPAFYNAEAASTQGVLPVGMQALGSIGRRGVTITDGLTNAVHLEEVRAGRRPNGAAEVSVRVLNCTSIPLQFEAATRFFDAGGAQAEPVTVWRRVMLPPRTSRDYTEISTSRTATSFMIDLRGGT